MEASPVRGRYDKPIDRESAYELLAKKRLAAGPEDAPPAKHSGSVPSTSPWGEAEREATPAPKQPRERAPARTPSRRASTTERVVTNLASSAARSIGTQIGRAIFRSILGSMTKR